MTFISLFSGMGGFDLALERVCMTCVLQVENDRHCQRVLRHHWPEVAKEHDIKTVSGRGLSADIVCGGSPCQDLSVAGKRAGLAGERSGLFHEFIRVTGEVAPRWVLWENVPGAFSSNDGRDFAIILHSLVQLGYGLAWRVLDSQYFGLAQRRKRVFIVGCLGGAARAAKVLFESGSVPWDSPPGREAGSRVAATITGGAAGGSSHGKKSGTDKEGFLVASPYTVNSEQSCAKERHAFEAERARTIDSSGGFATSQGGTVVSVYGGNDTSGARESAAALNTKGGGRLDFESENFVVGPLSTRQTPNGHGQAGVNNQERGRIGGCDCNTQDDLAYSLNNPGKGGRRQESNVAGSFGARRLTPLECLRLQGFPDNYLDIDGMSDFAKYRMIGNAVSVPVIEWIAGRIEAMA